MRLRVPRAMRFWLAATVVLLLAVTSSTIALRSASRSAAISRGLVERGLPSVRAAEELEIVLLEQRGLATAHIMQGGEQWLAELERRKPRLDFWLAEARRTAHAPVQHRLLDRLEATYRLYDQVRDRAITLERHGNHDAAASLLQGTGLRLAETSQQLCNALVEANQQLMESSVAAQRLEVQQTTRMVLATIALTVLMGIVMILILLRDLMLPLRGLAAYARSVSDDVPSSSPAPPGDELRSIGESLRTLTSNLDRTRADLEQSRERALNSEALASVGKLAACVAHEIRNPLTSMKLWLHSIREAAPGEPEVARRCEMVACEIVRLDRIVNNFLEFSRPPELRLEKQDLREVLQGTVDLFSERAREAGVHIVLEPGDAALLVRADGEQMRQVFLNLLVNAADATGPGGEIRIRSGVEANGPEGPTVLVRVEDTGSGLPEGVRARLFEPFVTTKEKGSGLGLSIVASILARHQGLIHLDTSVASGCAFDVRIPAARGESS